MRVVRIKTTAWDEEDFFLLTSLSDSDIAEVVNPIVIAERDGENEYDNDMLVARLVERYPLDVVEMYVEFETLEL
jgi:hypothetical protein